MRSDFCKPRKDAMQHHETTHILGLGCPKRGQHRHAHMLHSVQAASHVRI